METIYSHVSIRNTELRNKKTTFFMIPFAFMLNQANSFHKILIANFKAFPEENFNAN